MACSDRCDMPGSERSTHSSHNPNTRQSHNSSAISCSLSWQPPVTDREGELLGLRSPGDASNVTIMISGSPNLKMTLANRHKLSAREEKAVVELDDNGHFRVFSETPVPSDWPEGEWETFIESGGTVIRCGGFVIARKGTASPQVPPPATAPTGPPPGKQAGLFGNALSSPLTVVLIIGAVLFVAGRR